MSTYERWSLSLGCGVLWGKDNWFLSRSAQSGMRTQGNTSRDLSAVDLIEHTGKSECRWIFLLLNRAPCILIMSIIFPCNTYCFYQASSQMTVNVILVLSWNQTGKGITKLWVQIQAERALAGSASCWKSNMSPAWVVCANSRAQTQAARPTVSAKPLRFSV